MSNGKVAPGHRDVYPVQWRCIRGYYCQSAQIEWGYYSTARSSPQYIAQGNGQFMTYELIVRRL